MEFPQLSIKWLIHAGQINRIIIYCIETEGHRQIYRDSISKDYLLPILKTLTSTLSHSELTTDP